MVPLPLTSSAPYRQGVPTGNLWANVSIRGKGKKKKKGNELGLR